MNALTMRQRFRTCAFTLIELLVVVTIIALLIAILLPSLKKARDSAKATTCMSNLRQVTLSALEYAQDYKDHIPMPWDNPGQEYITWIELLEPYLKTADIVRCPGDQSTNWEPVPFNPTEGLRVTSFATNDRMTTHGSPMVTRFNEVKVPSNKIFLAELLEDVLGDHIHPSSWDSYLSFPEDEIAMKRHPSEKACYGLCDGHVERIKFELTWKIDQTLNMYDPTRQ